MPVAAPAFLSGEAKGGGKTFLGGKSIWLPIMYFHNTGHIPIFNSFPSFPPFPLVSLFLFASCGPFPFPLFFIPISCPSPPPFIHCMSAVSSPSGSGRSPTAKCNWVNSGPQNERFLKWKTKLHCSRKLFYFYW